MAIRLEKGQRINLEKGNGSKLTNICVGVNWGAITKKGWFGITRTEAVDLDASCAEFDAAGNVVDKVWFRHLASNDGAIKHSADDLSGYLDFSVPFRLFLSICSAEHRKFAHLSGSS